jgi:hypothetical protein
MRPAVMGVVLLSVIACLTVLLPRTAFPDDGGRVRRQNDLMEPIRFFAPFFLPKLINDAIELKHYVRGGEFRWIRRTRGDLAGVDAIFDRAMELSWGNVYEALLISFTASMDHRRFGVRIPVLGPILWVPLTSEFPDEFAERIRALPRNLYADTPPSGDRDKLQHFFGSAFLTYLFESRAVAERVGAFVEWGEDKFIVDGVLDERDERANNQGQEFGLHLLRGGSLPPSRFMTVAATVWHADEFPVWCAPGAWSDAVPYPLEVR